MASSNPHKLISLRDSLDKELSPGLIDSFIEAYNKVGIQAYNSKTEVFNVVNLSELLHSKRASKSLLCGLIWI